MIRCQDHKIPLFQEVRQFRQPPVKCLECSGISRNIAAMPEFTVEIDKIGKKQPAIGQ